MSAVRRRLALVAMLIAVAFCAIQIGHTGSHLQKTELSQSESPSACALCQVSTVLAMAPVILAPVFRPIGSAPLVAEQGVLEPEPPAAVSRGPPAA